MHERIVLGTLRVSDMPAEYQDTVTVADVTVRITMQRTGFGYRRYFICPNCTRKCGKLNHINLIKGALYCQSCIPINLYHVRRNLYDEAGTSLITWHMGKLAPAISGQPIKFPFDYNRYPIDPPPNMSRKKYRETLLKLQVLENMRFATLARGTRFTAADIRKYTGKCFISLFELWQVLEYQIFGTSIPAEYYSVIMDEYTVPERPPGYIGPIHLELRNDL